MRFCRMRWNSDGSAWLSSTSNTRTPARALTEQELVAKLKALPDVVEASVAGPGFINLRLAETLAPVLLPLCLAGLAFTALRYRSADD